MRIETLSKTKRQCFIETFDKNALLLLPHAQRNLLEKWLKNKSQKPKWETLLKITIEQAGHEKIEMAESLASSLVQCGAVTKETSNLPAAFWCKMTCHWH